jgi:serine/threonine protein kinase
MSTRETDGGKPPVAVPETDPAILESIRRLQAAVGEAYEIRELVGRGGFAEVYSAWDAKGQRVVAIKTLRQDVPASPAHRERFRREIEAVAPLRHPNIIPVLEIGEGEGMAWFAMPLVEGESLASVLRREEVLRVSEARRILREAASALGAAHAAGIIHRDIKPDNIMLEGPDRHVLLTDFGVAKALGSLDDSISIIGALVGTPFYMSPEQAIPGRRVDHRSDQYSLAVVGYRMMTGALPFDGESLEAVIYQHVHAKPKPIKQIRPIVPAATAGAIERALEKDPDARWESMAAFADALGASLAVSTAVAYEERGPVSSDEPDRVEREPRRGLRLVPIALVAIAGVTWWATRMSTPALPPPGATVAQPAPMPVEPSDSLRLGGRVPSGATSAIAAPPPAADRSTSGAEAPTALRVATPVVAAPDTARMSVTMADIRSELASGRAYHAQGKYVMAHAALRTALERLTSIDGGRPTSRLTDSLRREAVSGMEAARVACEAERTVLVRRGQRPPTCP